MQIYSDETREADPNALPDVEIFFWTFGEAAEYYSGDDHFDAQEWEVDELEGFYWWHCLPGCLPGSEAFGPFPTVDGAKADIAIS